MDCFGNNEPLKEISLLGNSKLFDKAYYDEQDRFYNDIRY